MPRAVLAAAWLVLLGVCVAEGAPGPRPKAPPIDDVFRARNPQAWSTVAVGPTGLVQRVVTADPDLRIRKIGKDGHFEWDLAALERVRALLRSNAELFGIDAADADRVRVKDGAVAYYDNDTGFLLAAILIEPGDGLNLAIVQPRIHVTPKITRDEVMARFVGHTYLARSRGVLAPPRDCGMGGRSDCKARTVVDMHRFTVTPEDVTVEQGQISFAGAQHLVHCVDLGQTSPGTSADAEQGPREVRPADGGPTVPLVIDAVTGKRLAVGGASCPEIWLRYVR